MHGVRNDRTWWCFLNHCGSPVWNPSKITDIQKLENVQRSFTRKISGCKDVSYWDRLKKLKLQSLQRRRERYCIIHTWKILNNVAPNDLEFEFYTHPRHGVRATVPSVNMKSQMSVRSDYDRSFRVKAAQLWNTLPAGVNSLSTLDSFKVGLGQFLEQFPDTPPVPGYTPAHDNSLLSWRRTHTLPLS